MNLHWIVAVPALVIALTGCTSARTAQEENTLFETHEIGTPAALHQIVLAGNFDGSGAPSLPWWAWIRPGPVTYD